MADDVNAAVRAEIEAALAVIGPQIDGLNDLTRIEASDEFITLARDQYNASVHREGLLQAVIAALDGANEAMSNLEADGYPAVEQVPVPPGLASEINKQKAESDAAYALIVGGEDAAAQVRIKFGPAETASSLKK